jgi:hypothetical protein
MGHRCHVRGCETATKPEHLMCAKHWAMVPLDMRRRVLDTYQPGQCRGRVRISREWLAAAVAARNHVEALIDAEPDLGKRLAMLGDNRAAGAGGEDG